MIQNADDAGATVVKVLINHKQYKTSSLLGPRMADWQGPGEPLRPLPFVNLFHYHKPALQPSTCTTMPCSLPGTLKTCRRSDRPPNWTSWRRPADSGWVSTRCITSQVLRRYFPLDWLLEGVPHVLQ